MKIEMVHVIQPAPSVANKHKVPVRQWRKWPAQARSVFNEVYGTMRKNQYVFLHPQQELLSARKWQTVAWNAAWTAADAAKAAA